MVFFKKPNVSINNLNKKFKIYLEFAWFALVI